MSTPPGQETPAPASGGGEPSLVRDPIFALNGPAWIIPARVVLRLA